MTESMCYNQTLQSLLQIALAEARRQLALLAVEAPAWLSFAQFFELGGGEACRALPAAAVRALRPGTSLALLAAAAIRGRDSCLDLQVRFGCTTWEAPLRV